MNIYISANKCLQLDVFGMFPERRVGGVRMEVCEGAVPNLRHPGLCEPQVTIYTVLDTTHCLYQL